MKPRLKPWYSISPSAYRLPFQGWTSSRFGIRCSQTRQAAWAYLLLTVSNLRACLEVVLWRRKWPIWGSHKGIFEPHSGAMGQKNGEVRFQKWSFAAQTATSKQALRLVACLSRK